MKKIVSVIKPFIMQQNVFVYENGNKIDVINSTLDDIEDNFLNLIDKYNIEQIELIGPKNYSKGIKKKFQEKELSKYNKNSVNIKLF